MRRSNGWDEKGYFNSIVKELAIEDTAEYEEMMRIRRADFQRVLRMSSSSV